MSHADVAAIIGGAIGTPGRLRALLAAETEESAAVRAHLADCDECRSEAAAWQAVDEALVAVTPETMRAPASARARILGNVLATGVARSPDLVLGTTRGSSAGTTGAAGTAGTGAGTAGAAVTGAAGTAGTGAGSAAVTGAGTAAGAANAAAVTAAAATDPASAAPAAGEPPAAGRVWRTPGGAPLPSPMPAPVPLGTAATDPSAAPVAPVAHPVAPSAAASSAAAPNAAAPAEAPAAPDRRGLRLLTGGKEGDGVGFRLFLAVAAAAVFLFALGAALGGPLGLTTPTTVQDTAARTELEKVAGRMSDLLQLPGATVAPLMDQNGEPAGAVVLASADTRLLGVVTRALPALPEGGRYVCILERGDERFEVGYMKFAGDPATDGDVAYWIAPLSEAVPLDAGAPGDTFSVFVDGQTSGEPLLTTTF